MKDARLNISLNPNMAKDCCSEMKFMLIKFASSLRPRAVLLTAVNTPLTFAMILLSKHFISTHLRDNYVFSAFGSYVCVIFSA